MSSPFKVTKGKVLKPGSLQYDLHETNKDIKQVANGGEAEASMAEMMEARKRIKRQIMDEVSKETKAAATANQSRDAARIANRHNKPNLRRG
jgi:hypothetical protein